MHTTIKSNSSVSILSHGFCFAGVFEVGYVVTGQDEDTHHLEVMNDLCPSP